VSDLSPNRKIKAVYIDKKIYYIDLKLKLYMNLNDIIETYLKGWELGDGNLSLSVTCSEFFYDDPNAGSIQRDNFIAFVNDFKQAAVDMGGDVNARPFLEYRDIVITKETSPATAWCWWQAKGTPLQGSALIKFDQSGILHEQITHFNHRPDELKHISI